MSETQFDRSSGLRKKPLSGKLSDMKSVPVREISKNWTRVLQEHAGSEVPITNRGEVVAFLRIPPRKKGQKVKVPDFRQRIRARFGDRALTAADSEWLHEAMRSKY